MSSGQQNKEIADMLQDFCLKEGYDFYPDYSGRCMYGRKCVGIVHEDNVARMLMRLAGHVFDYFLHEPDEAAVAFHHLEDIRQDNMGLGTITYWPNISANTEN
jgi:hypothetical protein